MASIFFTDCIIDICGNCFRKRKTETILSFCDCYVIKTGIGGYFMIDFKMDYTYIVSGGVKLFTASLLPDATRRFPTVIIRTPYVDRYETYDEDDIVSEYMNEYKIWLKNGYAVIVQHCRGRGKSDGDCIPYINEREDGLALQEWIRQQSFYNGELYLKGESYLTSVHYVTAPFAEDIKGAVFGVQDSERYNICYRNGFMKKALNGSWYVETYKAKSHMKKNYTYNSFNLLPLSNFTKTVFGEKAEDFDEMLKAPNPDDEFWSTRFGGNDARHATDNVKFPVLFTTGFYDLYTGGIFDMWHQMNENSRANCALVVSPYDHVDSCDAEDSIVFENGKRVEQFGQNYEVEWFNSIRDKNRKWPFERGKVTYYSLFENKWKCDNFNQPENKLQIKLGDKEVTYTYNPYDAPSFKGGLSCNSGGTVFQDKPNSRYDIVSVYTEPFSEDILIKGKMSAKLFVKTDCDDTCFYVRISISKERGDYGLRDDITSILFQHEDYKKNEETDLTFNFDEHSFLIKKGEKLRIDIASADNAHYVRHTNNKGLYSEQTTAKIAQNTVFLNKSYILLPVEKA